VKQLQARTTVTALDFRRIVLPLVPSSESEIPDTVEARDGTLPVGTSLGPRMRLDPQAEREAHALRGVLLKAQIAAQSSGQTPAEGQAKPNARRGKCGVSG
jgi:hypothetical protein